MCWFILLCSFTSVFFIRILECSTTPLRNEYVIYFCFSPSSTDSSLSSESSHVSSPAGSHLSTPFNSPVPSPLSSPNLDSVRHHQDSDTGVGSLSPTSVDNSNEKEEKPDSKGGDKSPWRERRDSGVGSSLTRPSG